MASSSSRLNPSACPSALAFIGAMALCALIAFIVAVPSTRLEGFYLALAATLAFAQLFTVLINEGGDLTGGTGGHHRLFACPGIFVPAIARTVVHGGSRPAGGRHPAAAQPPRQVVLRLRLPRHPSKPGRRLPLWASMSGAPRSIPSRRRSTLAGLAGVAYSPIRDNVIIPRCSGSKTSFYCCS